MARAGISACQRPDAARLDAYECWRSPTKIDLESLLGKEDWEKYWSLCEAVIEELRRCQQVADTSRARVIEQLRLSPGSVTTAPQQGSQT